jgi:hypothetical protein
LFIKGDGVRSNSTTAYIYLRIYIIHVQHEQLINCEINATNTNVLISKCVAVLVFVDAVFDIKNLKK